MPAHRFSQELTIVRQRLEGIALAAQIPFASLPVEVITAPSKPGHLGEPRERLTNTVEQLQPILLILDPLIRLHRVDENDATQIAGLLSFLRQLQRQFKLAVLLVHHARKDSNSSRPGQALRGSSELHGWGDSNLYMRRKGAQLTLSTEHRAAPSQDHIPLHLAQAGSALALALARTEDSDPSPESVAQRVRRLLAEQKGPISVQRLRQLCGLRTSTVCAALAELSEQGLVCHDSRGYQLKLHFEDPLVSLSRPIGSPGNGNGKH